MFSVTYESFVRDNVLFVRDRVRRAKPVLIRPKERRVDEKIGDIFMFGRKLVV